MQDFTKASKRGIEAKQVAGNITAEPTIKLAEMPNLPNQPKSSFIKARLNKDNFWNLMFFLGMISGFKVASSIAHPVGGILCWLTILGVPSLVKWNSKVTFDKNKLEFIINGNMRVKASGAEFMLLIFASFGVMAMVGLTLDRLMIDDTSILSSMMGSIVIFLPTLYCILRNIPIALYFKKEVWIGDGNNNSEESYKRRQGSSKSVLSLDRMRNDPINSWSATNIYHKR